VGIGDRASSGKEKWNIAAAKCRNGAKIRQGISDGSVRSVSG